MMSLYEISSQPTAEKIESYNGRENIYYRLQHKDLEMGSKSWEMIYTTEGEALEDGATVLNGKSCCATAAELKHYSSYHGDFGDDYVVLILFGFHEEWGHDGEPVITVEDVEEIWSREEFLACF